MTAKKSNTAFIAFVVAGLLILGVAMFFALPQPPAPPADDAAATAEQPAGDEAAATAESPEATTEDQQAAEEDVADDSGYDLAEIKAERILGNPSAPIKISEFASLTCSHCAHFHTASFDQVKAELIDTGKAYFVFSDFPLNAPALHASMVARCLPKEKYFDFVSEMFKEQEGWAFDPNYIAYVKAKAEAYGMPADRFKACVESKAIQKIVISRMEAAQKMWDIKATPTFVINNKTVISGALPPEEFIKQVTAPATPPTETQAAP